MSKLLCICCLCLGCMLASGVELVKNNIAVGEFILRKDASFTEIYAVRDVRHWIKKMTGAKVPIVSKISNRKPTKVFVGKTFASGFKDDLKKLNGTEGFAIRRKGNNIYVFGDRPLGTLHGVYALLEKNSDIIWARPNPSFGTVYGKHKNLNLSKTDMFEIPSIWWRAMRTAGYPSSRYGAIWNIRNGLNTLGRRYGDLSEWDTNIALNNNLFGPIRNRFGMKHPEWYAYKPSTKSRHYRAGALCLSAPGLPEIWAKTVADEIKSREKLVGKAIRVHVVGPGDNWFCCQCKDCLKPIKLPDGTMLKCKHPESKKDSLFRSTQFQIFMNKVMKHWKKLCPHTRLVSLAYIHLAEPPAVEPDPDFLVCFAPYPTSSMHFPLLDPKQPKQWRKRFQKWLKKTKTLGFYEYFYSKPTPQAFYAAENIRAVLKNGGNPADFFFISEIQADRGRGSLGDGSRGWDVGGMNAWVIAKLLWDINQDVDKLYKYYLKRTYREAAPEMIKYYEMMRDIWLDPKDKTVDACHTLSSHVFNSTVIKRGFEKKCFSLLNKAEKLAKNPNSKTMIRRKIGVFKSFGKGFARLMLAKIDEMGHDGDTFESVQWEKPEIVDDFKITRLIGKYKTPVDATYLKAAHDGKNLYLRFTALDSKISKLESKKLDKGKEFWTKGDHIEFWLKNRNRFVFSFDHNGNIYDAKNLDRDWNSGWKVKTRKTKKGWEAIAIIPMDALGITPGKKGKWTWFCIRQISHKGEKPIHISFAGQPLYAKDYPVIIE